MRQSGGFLRDFRPRKRRFLRTRLDALWQFLNFLIRETAASFVRAESLPACFRVGSHAGFNPRIIRAARASSRSGNIGKYNPEYRKYRLSDYVRNVKQVQGRFATRVNVRWKLDLAVIEP